MRSADDKKVIGILAEAFEAFPVLELPPGEHVLSVGMQNRGAIVTTRSVEDCIISLSATAGHTYEIHCEIGRKNWMAWLIDTNDGSSAVPCRFPDSPPAVPPCGDGFLSLPDEQCDDGNTASGDGCSESCRIEGPGPADVAVCACPGGQKGDGVLVHYAEPIGQMFIPRASLLSGVAVYATYRRPAPLELRLHSGSITGPIVAISTSGRDVGWVRLFTLKDPVGVTPGASYVIELREPDDNALWADATGCAGSAPAFQFGEPAGVTEGTSFLFMTFGGN